MKRWTQIILSFSVAILALFVSFKATFLFVAWEHQHEAERLLAAVRDLQPQVTTVEDLQEKVFAKFSEFGSKCKSDVADDQAADAWINNWPSNWSKLPFYRLPARWRLFSEKLLLPRWTNFGVTFYCRQGKLEAVYVEEAQELRGSERYSPRPNGYAATTELISSWRPIVEYLHATDWHSHYMASESWEDGHLGERRVGYQVAMDNDATPEQRRSALDFNLNCFTRLRGCQDIDLILQPVGVKHGNPFHENAP